MLDVEGPESAELSAAIKAGIAEARDGKISPIDWSVFDDLDDDGAFSFPA